MDLKRYLDAVNTAQARVQVISADIDTLFTEGKTEDAIAKRPDLDKAREGYDQANQLYLSMLNATATGNDPAVRVMRAGGDAQVIKDAADQPFEHPGKFFQAVKDAALYPGREDPRLRPMRVKDAASGMNETVPAEGGYLLQPEENAGILEKIYATGQILSRVSMDTLTGNGMVYNGIDETTRVTGSRTGGVTGYWVAEGGTITASKPKFYQLELKLKKVAALCYATDEMLEDVSALASWIGRTVPNELRFMVEDAFIEGDGVGKPLGIMNSPCLVSQARDTAAKVKAEDIGNMWARRYTGVNDYVWLVNPAVTPQLAVMSIAYAPVYTPAGDMSNRPYGLLYGCPVIESEYCQDLNTSGDIMLASLSQYQAVSKASGVQSASSIHVAFATGDQAFRFTYRVDGEPLWHSALTPLHGSNTVSPFVVLGSASA